MNAAELAKAIADRRAKQRLESDMERREVADLLAEATRLLGRPITTVAALRSVLGSVLAKDPGSQP